MEEAQSILVLNMFSTSILQDDSVIIFSFEKLVNLRPHQYVLHLFVDTFGVKTIQCRWKIVNHSEEGLQYSF